MPKSELPKYFTKYLDGKFEDISDDISELKSTVNSIQGQLNNQKLMTTIIASGASLLTTILSPFRK